MDLTFHLGLQVLHSHRTRLSLYWALLKIWLLPKWELIPFEALYNTSCIISPAFIHSGKSISSQGHRFLVKSWLVQVLLSRDSSWEGWQLSAIWARGKTPNLVQAASGCRVGEGIFPCCPMPGLALALPRPVQVLSNAWRTWCLSFREHSSAWEQWLAFLISYFHLLVFLLTGTAGGRCRWMWAVTGCVLRPSMPSPCWYQHRLSLLTCASALPGLHGQADGEVLAGFLITPE